MRKIPANSLVFGLLLTLILTVQQQSYCQVPAASWIRPENSADKSIWGIRNGIVFGLWPHSLEPAKEENDGGPRGLIRVGYEYLGAIYLINFIAIEPVVNGKIEFSEISPSRADEKWGKLMWASDSDKPSGFYPTAKSRGVITKPDPQHPGVEELSLYIHMEQFLNGAYPYLRLSIRSDRPEELGLQIFNREGSAVMDRCVLTATMGNYARVRELHLKDKIVDSRELYKGFDDIDFVEKAGYPASQLIKTKKGDLIALATSNESFSELSSWPQEPRYHARWGWRYRPFFKLTQYWRKEGAGYDPSLQVRVNGRARYWSGGTQDKSAYVPIPGGPSFENFEMREKYYSGQKFFFGISRRVPSEILDEP